MRQTMESIQEELRKKEPESVELLDKETEHDFVVLAEEIKSHLKNKGFIEGELKIFIKNILDFARKTERMRRALHHPSKISENISHFPGGCDFLSEMNMESSMLNINLSGKNLGAKKIAALGYLTQKAQTKFELLIDVFSKYLRGENI